ncbi:MBL fold metallo-hydrolase [Craterilacuibacter sinensis]|uniref:MBL fold metallo-hydrolase n=1 Tax=Craterilacuibacter sinensis TaxID=2686017 RepID=A0A845BNP1_9NEIS|nr:MBL fold metallo-hydrolase [Craterilacuibacter sinensis]MXR38207.1 MBL fold metallo-hydrolase [Craterilacuibacter sinensis]RQW23283.1 MBL fold metallo-hydrolase [Rhodobacteraceae bacterium CH30]
MKLTPLDGNSQKLDGGAMFGNAPRALWSRYLAPDEANRVPLACRCLLVETAGQRILLETGIGAFFSPEMRERYGVVEAQHVLLDALAAQGLSDADIDVVILSHLHFDHAGGLLAAWDGGPARLLFPNARFVAGRAAWQRALTPHARDRASFIPELIALLQASGRLVLSDGEMPDCLPQDWRFHLSHGHTPGMLLTEIPTQAGPLVFAADLIPGTPWVHVPITMGYDRYPEMLIDEKQALLEGLLAREGGLFFTHDPHLASGRVVRDGKGRFGVEDWGVLAVA